MRAYIINREIDDIRGTLFRQTMFAEFERIIHAIEESGDALTLDVFKSEYHKLLEAYFAENFVLDPELDLECLRIPHFYHAFYVYKYATGISAAVTLSQRVLSGQPGSVEAYLKFLRSGGSEFPLETLKAAGVDMTTSAPSRARCSCSNAGSKNWKSFYCRASVSGAVFQGSQKPQQVRMQLDPERFRQRLKRCSSENFEKFGELGAAVSVWQNGKPMVDLYGGFCDAGREKPWTADTVVLVWSATKGIGSACVLHALQQQKIELNRPVAEFWPEFGQADKDKITFGQLLSHQAGLCALDQRVDVLDYDGVIRALEAQAPLWPPGTAHGYHARTFGFLLDELMRRITGKKLSEYWQENFAGRSNSISGSACRKSRIHEWPRFMLPKVANRRSQSNSIAILLRPERWRERRLLRLMG